MKLIQFVAVLLLSIIWIIVLDKPRGPLPPLGRFFDPMSGFWANAEPFSDSRRDVFNLPQDKLKQRVTLHFDERLVPHISANNDSDLYFAQGYIHAAYRLWQMDFLTRAAAGRLSEVIGEKTFDFDREQRRKGMVWAAENSLRAMEKNEVTKAVLDSYTAGVNAYIDELRYEHLPVEYKLMDFYPEKWTNLKSALLLKYMADDLTGKVNDIPMSYMRTAFSPSELQFLFPERNQNADPVIPKTDQGSFLSRPAIIPYGQLFVDFPLDGSKTTGVFSNPQNRGIGSNNWVVRKVDSISSSVILCNDPHLGLSLPSLWYEVQLSGPDINCYGVSIPGAPGIVIGFNDSISWGVTNNYRDVKDYYELKSEDDRFYFMDGKDIPFNYRIEEIAIRNKEEVFKDTIRFSIHGPLMYDERYPEPSGSGKLLAMTWMAHRGTNELYSLYLLNRAQNYKEFVDAIKHFECPAQNFVYGDRSGNIAMWGQGRFPNKWKDQGRYVMRGDISSTLWNNDIPMSDNPHTFNPSQNYLASANQTVTDPSYPYWYNGNFSEFRSWELNDLLKDSTGFDVQKMMRLQNNNWSFLAENLLPLYYAYGAGENEYREYFPPWDAVLEAESKVATSFQIWWHFLYHNIWKDEFKQFPFQFYPSQERTLQLILADSSSKYFDDITTEEKETLSDIAKRSFTQTWDSIATLKKRHGGDEWFKAKNTSLTHLARLEAFSFNKLKTGGWGNTINAMKPDHGPTWRMIVSMDKDAVRAYCNYPGGQSGNPGSKYYAQFIDHWVNGQYYEVNFKARKQRP